MAEIPNSDSPDPLSSTPPLPTQFFASSAVSTASTPSLPSTPSRVSTLDVDDYPESSNRQTPTLEQQHQRQRETSLLSSLEVESPAQVRRYPRQIRARDLGSSSSPSPVSHSPMSHNAGRGYLPADIVARLMVDPEDEESLFVSDDDHRDHDNDYFYDDYDDNGALDNANAGEFRADPPWADLIVIHQQRDADELVEMEVMQARGPRGNQRQQQPRAQPEVIDLTGDSDSHPAQPAQPGPQHHSQNTRRQRSQQRNNLPRLARSDASYMEPHNVINLISDSDDEDPAVMPPPRRSNPPRPRARPAAPAPPRPQPQDHQPAAAPFAFPARPDNGLRGFHIFNLPFLRIVNNGSPMADNGSRRRDHDEEDIVIMGHRNVVPNPPPPPPPPPNLRPVDLDYLVHPFANQPHAPGGLGAKPAHEPPKETREGFTRNTGEDVVAICPSCELELAYDPDDDDGRQGPPAKKARTKKDKAEHHFWAVKACGHVYCRSCYENRKPVGKNPAPVGFRREPNGPKNHVLCAVEDCESDVSAKSAWVGIFM